MERPRKPPTDPVSVEAMTGSKAAALNRREREACVPASLVAGGLREEPAARGRNVAVQNPKCASKLGMFRRPRIRNHVANVRHPGEQQHDPFEPQAEAGMGHRSITAQVDVPPVLLGVKAAFLHPGEHYVESLFA